MKKWLYSIKIKKAISIALAISFTLSLMTFISTMKTAQAAGLVVGQSTTLTAAGSKLGTNGGILDMDQVIFSVGITRDPDGFVAQTDGKKNVMSKFKTKIPNNRSNSIYVMTKTLHDKMVSQLGKFTSAWYNSSKKSLEISGKQEYIDRIRTVSQPASEHSTGVYYTFLSGNYSLEGKAPHKSITSLANGKWKTLLSQKTEDECLDTYEWVFQNNGGSFNVEQRLGWATALTGLDPNNIKNWSVLDKTRAKLKILDFMMISYRLLSDAVPGKIEWEQAINDWISGVDLKEKPITFVVDTAVGVNPGNPYKANTGAILIPTIDYLNYFAGVEAAYSLNESSWSGVTPYSASGLTTESQTYKNFSGSVKQSISASPTFKRISDAYDANNAFSWAASAMANKRLTTGTGVPVWKATSVAASYLDAVKIPGADYADGKARSGFMMVLCPTLTAPSLGIKLNATPKDKILTDGATMIGVPVDLKISTISTPELIETWRPLLETAKSTGKPIYISYSIVRDPVGGIYTEADYIAPQKRQISTTALEEFIKGTSQLPLLDTSTTNAPILEGETKKFTYNITMNIEYEGQTYTGKATDYASFILRGAGPQLIQYISDPSAYSEIKEGRPYNEKYDAMAGVPSTETLYLGSGGSEFITEVTLEYRKDETTTRKYRSYFGGTSCEFKDGDTAKPQTLGEQSVNLHNGGTYSKTWTGTTPWTGSGGVSGHIGFHSDSWNDASFNAGVTVANAFAATVNGTTLSHRAQSDGITRSQTGWGASVAASNPHNTGSHTIGQVYIAPTPPSGTPPSGGSPGQPFIAGTYTPGTANNWTITVTWTVTAHIICGPCCEHELPQVEDTWAQTMKFDHLRIVESHVWKIDKSSVDGMTEITGTDEWQANIVQGDPNIFYNIAKTQTSVDGRIRYTVEPRQHDWVTWNEGTRTNNCNGLGNTMGRAGGGHSHAWADGILYTNGGYPVDTKDYEVTNSDTKDKATSEYAKFKERRETQNVATVISDMLILQTSSGDQSIIYFQKDSQSKQTQEQIPKVVATKEEMWDNNTNSAAKWTPQQINIGSYNSKFNTPATKYEGTGNKASVGTKFDNDPAGSITRPTRPSQLFLYKNNIPQIVTNSNKSYITGDSEVFWKNILDKKSSNTAAPYPMMIADSYLNTIHSTDLQAKYGTRGHIKEATYSDDHGKVNDIIVHDPVSTERAIVVALNDSRDQRSTMPLGSAEQTLDDLNKLQICPRDPGLCEFRVLNCTYFQDRVLASYDFEDGTLKNNITGIVSPMPAGFSVEDNNKFGTGKSLVAKGIRWSIPLSELGISYSADTKLYVEADYNVPVAGVNMLAGFYRYDFFVQDGSGSWNTGHGMERQTTSVFAGENTKIGMEFDFSDLNKNKLFINGVEKTGYVRLNESDTITAPLVGDSINIGSWIINNAYPANLKLDNLKIIKKAGTSEHTSACYKPMTFHPDGLNKHIHTAECLNGGGEVPVTKTPTTFSYTGGAQTFIVPEDGIYKLETWGAQGGTVSTNSGVTYTCNNLPKNDTEWYECVNHPDGHYRSIHTHNASCSTTGGSTYTGSGGNGGYSTGTVRLNKGQILSIYIGGQGIGDNVGTNAAGGFNGGGTGNYFSGGGGGATDIRSNGAALTNRIIVAGGGGGGQLIPNSALVTSGGAGGGATGNNGNTHGNWSVSYISGGGTQTAGGTNTSGWNGAGSLGAGGTCYSSYIGGGGGGYYGGAAGAYHGYSGAGGSGYTTGLTDASMISGQRTGHGQAKITQLTSKETSGVDYVLDELINGNITGNANVTLGNIGLQGEQSRITGIPYNPTWSTGYAVSDVLVGQNYIYVLHMNMNYVSQYNKNSDGTIGSFVRTTSWYNSDSAINTICRNNSSEPSAYAMFIENGQDKLVGWSMNSAVIQEWTINTSSNTPYGRTQYTAPMAITAYSRGGWDGGQYVYFFNRGSNGLYKWDIQNKSSQPTNVVTLAQGASYMSSSWTGSGLLVDKDADEVYGSSGSNNTLGLLTGWKLSTGELITGSTSNPWKGAQMTAAGVAPINGDVGTIALTALHRNIGYYFSNYVNEISQIKLCKMVDNTGVNTDKLKDILGPAYENIIGAPSSIYKYTWTGADTKGFRALNKSTVSVSSNKLLFSITGADPQSEVMVNIDAKAVKQIKITFDNNTTGTNGQMFYKIGSGAYEGDKVATYSMLANSANQVATMDMTNNVNWIGDITGLRFDLSEASSGNVQVTSIEFIGYGTSTSVTGGTGQIWDYTYTGGQQQLNMPSGNYKLEVWGAQGGRGYINGLTGSGLGGNGGYSYGEIQINTNDTLYMYVGSQGGSSASIGSGGWNGGGNSQDTDADRDDSGGGGGGATDIRRGSTALSSRIIVAGGGGGGGCSTGNGGPGGGLSGIAGSGVEAAGGTQSTGYSIGIGGPGYQVGGGVSGAGGGGYYGGNRGTSVYAVGGGGGSGYVNGLQNAQTIAGNSSFVSPSGENEVGHPGNGYARITSLFNPLKIVYSSPLNIGTSGLQNFGYTGNIQTFKAPYSGEYTIQTWGAQGGTGSGGYNSGKGAYSTSKVTLTKDESIKILVGGQGGNYNSNAGSGGGGTFVARVSNAPIAVAGGGGGTYMGCLSGTYYHGQPTQNVQNFSYGGDAVTTGYGGSSGGTTYSTSGAGGGFYGNGEYNANSGGGSGGYSFTNGGGVGYGTSTGTHGGFGGGGGTWYVGGGGGGYTGGHAGTGHISTNHTGGGGGSYFTGIASYAKGGWESMPSTSGGTEIGHTGNGYVKITWQSGQDIAALKQKIIDNFALIPDKLPDGTLNPIWGCKGLPLNTHVCTPNCYTSNVLMCSEPHHYGLHYDGSNDICWDPCNNDLNHKTYKPEVKGPNGEAIPNGKLINLDWPFRVYFPNIGNFEEGQSSGLAFLTSTRGKGYVDDMDTTKWTKAKRVKFDYNVIYDKNGDGNYTTDQLYLAGEWIDLPVTGTTYPYYNFYCVLANGEAKSARVQFEVEAINSPGFNDNIASESNRKRTTQYTALHGGHKDSYIDVVGRIGNIAVTDTGDYRFCNFFKVPVAANEWIVDGIIKKVETSKQNLFMGWSTDLRGLNISNSDWSDTYGTQNWRTEANGFKKLPLSPNKNNVVQLKTQPLRPGYDIFTEITTIGNYQDRLQVVPYYYELDLETNEITPVDVYMISNKQYKIINMFGAVHSGWKDTHRDQDINPATGKQYSEVIYHTEESSASDIYDYILNLDWVGEAERRNYTVAEKDHTDKLAQLYKEIINAEVGGEMQVTGEREMNRPVGKFYSLGTAQLLVPSTKARTLIGTDKTNGIDMNPGNRIYDENWWYSAQRWHLTIGLPSSSVFVKQGQPTTEENLKEIADGNHVILCTADIQAIGDTFVLKYDQGGDNGSIVLGGKTYVMPSNIPTVLAVYSANKTSTIDVDIKGTH